MTIPQDAAAVNVAIRTWLVRQIGASGALAALFAAPYTVIWAAQDGPRPAVPYATLQWVQPWAAISGWPARELITVGDVSTARYEYDVQATMRIELFVKAALDPASGLDETSPILSALEISLRLPAQTEAFNAVGIAFGQTRAPVAVPFIIGFSHERRGQLEIIFRSRVRVDVANAYVLDVESLSDISGSVDESGAVIGIVTTPEE